MTKRTVLDIFRTVDDVVYRYNPEHRLFITDQGEVPYHIVGSVDPAGEIELVRGEPRKLSLFAGQAQARIFFTSFSIAEQSAYTPELRVGYKPFGIGCRAEELGFVAPGRISMRRDDRNGLERRDRSIDVAFFPAIAEVYRQLTPEERGYEVRGG